MKVHVINGEPADELSIDAGRVVELFESLWPMPALWRGKSAYFVQSQNDYLMHAMHDCGGSKGDGCGYEPKPGAKLLTEGRNWSQIRQDHDLRAGGNPMGALLRSEAIMSAAKGISGDTVADIREVALSWDDSAKQCDNLGEPELAQRDRRFAAAMREAADVLEMVASIKITGQVDGLYGRLSAGQQKFVRKIADAPNYDYAAMELLDAFKMEWRE